MNIKPLHDKILIERIETIKETSSGIILRHSEEPDKAKVLAIGPDVNEVQVGDIVQPDWGKTVKAESSEKTFLIKIEDIAYIYDKIFRKPSAREIEEDVYEQEEFDRILEQNRRNQKLQETSNK